MASVRLAGNGAERVDFTFPYTAASCIRNCSLFSVQGALLTFRHCVWISPISMLSMPLKKKMTWCEVRHEMIFHHLICFSSHSINVCLLVIKWLAVNGGLPGLHWIRRKSDPSDVRVCVCVCVSLCVRMCILTQSYVCVCVYAHLCVCYF